MGWSLKVPANLRIFESITASPVPTIRPVGNLIKDRQVEVAGLSPVACDQQYKPALPFKYNGKIYYVLVEEINDEIAAAAHNWTVAYEQSRVPGCHPAIKKAFEADAERHKATMLLMLRRYFRTAGLRVVA